MVRIGQLRISASHFRIPMGTCRGFRRRFAIIVVSMVVLGSSSPQSHGECDGVVDVTVSAQCNIYGAGHPFAPNPGGAGGGSLPVMLTLPPGELRTVEVSAASGDVQYCPTCVPANGPDGAPFGFSMASWEGISGVSSISRSRFLAGVFLSSNVPMDPPPPSLDFSDYSFLQLAPALNQTFFIGDGLTGTGSGQQQTFVAPEGATRLFLGLFDSLDTLPGWYGDNTGAFTLTLSLGLPRLGDMNNDGVVNPTDTLDFVAALIDPDGFVVGHPNVPVARADMNCDGSVDGADINGFVRRLIAP